MNMKDLSLHGLIGGGSNIKSIQRGTISPWLGVGDATKDITISAINPSNSIILVNILLLGNPTVGKSLTYGTIINGTTIRLARNVSAVVSDTKVTWQVIEFNNVKRIQTGTILGTSTITITSVDINKSFVVCALASSVTGFTGDISDFSALAYLSNANTLNIECETTTSVIWQVIEFN